MKKVSWFEYTSEPSGLVVTLDELKAHLRIDGSDEDSELTIILYAAQAKIQTYLNVELRAASVRGNYAGFELDQFEKYPFISFKKWPIRDLTAVKYWNGSSYTAMTVTTDYLLEERSKAFPKVLFKNNPYNYDFSTDIAYPFIIEADVGYVNAAAVPYEIKLAIMMYAAGLYDNRGDCEDCACDTDGTPKLSNAVRTLISGFKMREVFG